MNNKGQGLRKFLIELRESRKKELDFHSMIISFNGMHGSGKSTEIKKLEETLRARKITVNGRRPSGMVRSDERRGYMEEIKKTNIENLDRTLELYTKDAVEAWREQLVPLAQREGIIILDRDPYSSLAYQLIVRESSPRSKEALDLAERLFAHPITPSDLAIFPTISAKTALRREVEKYEAHKNDPNVEDIFDPYYIVAYAMCHNGKLASKNTMRLWWLEATMNMFREIRRLVPEGFEVNLSGKESNKLNRSIDDQVSKVYKKFSPVYTPNGNGASNYKAKAATR